MGGVIDFGLVDEPVDEITHVVAPYGEIDALTAPRLGRRLLDLVEDGKRLLVVDLSEVTFMDSTGISVLLNALRHLKTRSGNLVLVCPTQRILRPFQITGLVGRLGIFSLARRGARRRRRKLATASRRRASPDSRCRSPRSAAPASAGGGVSFSGLSGTVCVSGTSAAGVVYGRRGRRLGVVAVSGRRRGLGRGTVRSGSGGAGVRLVVAATPRRLPRARRAGGSAPGRHARHAGEVSLDRRGAGDRSEGSRSGPSGPAAPASIRTDGGSPPRRAARSARGRAAERPPRP